MTARIRVYKRRAWRKEGGKYVPDGGARKTTVRWVETPEQARALCLPHNATLPPFGTAEYYNFIWMEWETL